MSSLSPELLELVYGAAQRPDGLRPLLAELSRQVGADASVFLQHDCRTGTAAGIVDGFDASAMHGYQRHYAAVNHWMPDPDLAPDTPVPPVLSTDAFLPLPALRETEFYQDWGRYNNTVFCLASSLELAAGRFTFLSFNRGERTGRFPESSTALLTELHPHLVRSLSIAADLARAEFQLAAGAVSGAAVVYLADDGMVLEMSARAAELAKAGDGIGIGPGRTLLCGAGRFNPLTAALKDLRAQPALPLRLFEVNRPSGRPSYPAALRRLNARPFVPASLAARFSVTIVEIDDGPASGLQAIARLFELTPAESLLVERLLKEGSLEQAIRAFDINRNTAKSQLQMVFEKTRTRHQSELLRLVAAAVTRLGGE